MRTPVDGLQHSDDVVVGRVDARLTITNDQRLLAADDERRERMIARACTPRGKLWREPSTGTYACIYTNPDGEAIVQAIPDAPYLDAWEPAGGNQLVAARR
ncbi:Uncharacterised protein [Achromobacter insolitus]|nr:hypothetical protein [Achromobacter insolitus]CAB3716363.1 hypothetical protein LMG6003_03518 [Achromobacter insolitus]VEG67741.1 Uncharacterised protein [Achromobacter insolitus]